MKQVIVIGAGLAGLSAAYELSKKSDYKIKILEKRKRTGGRVFAAQAKGVTVDFGGFMIFPWYDHYLEYCRELGIRSDVSKMPQLKIHHVLNEDGEIGSNPEDAISFFSKVKAGLSFLPRLFFTGDIDHPNLDHFKDKTIAQYVETLNMSDKDHERYCEILDTVSQGYCYPSIYDYKAAFGVPIYPKLILKGDADDSFYFHNGSDMLPNALEKHLKEKGVEFVLDCEVQKVDGKKVQTSQGDFEADEVIFALTADHDLYNKEINYTTFITAVVELEYPYLEDMDWGAVFYETKDKTPEALSIINTEKLYQNEKLKNCYTLNIKVKPEHESDPEAAISQSVEELLEGKNKLKEIIIYEFWQQAMPISTENFVRQKREQQGLNGHFFAGDYLGCPSMETAIITGQKAAQKLLNQK